MSFAAFTKPGAVVTPGQLSRLQAVFNRVCDECGEARDSEGAQRAGAVMVRSLQRGIEDDDVLADIGRAVLRS